MKEPLAYGKRWWMRTYLWVMLALMYAPILTLIAFSFNNSKRNIVWKGFTLKYYGVAWNNASLVEAFTNSLVIAAMCTVFATVLGTLVAVTLWRFRFPAKSAYEGFVGLPIVVPEICMGIGMLVFFSRIGWPTGLPWPLNLSAITVAHIAFAFPFVAIVVRSRLSGFNRELAEASQDLGASEWQTFRYVLLPYMMPGVIAGALLAFTLSLDDFVITFFTSGAETTTFPVKVYSLVRRGVSPDVNAASTALIVITVLTTLVAMQLYRPAPSDIAGGDHRRKST